MIENGQQSQPETIKEIYSSPIEVYTPTQIQTRLLKICQAGITKVRPMIEFASVEQLQSFKQALNQEQQSISSSDSDSQPQPTSSTHQQTIDIDQKKAIILQRHYTKQISQISTRFSTKLIFTSNKIKLFTDSDDKIDLCLRHLSTLSQKIEVTRITKGGPVLYQSGSYVERLQPIRMLHWEGNFYFYFNRDEIQCERARGVIKETEELQHFGCFLLPRYNGPRIYRDLVFSIHGKFVQEKILKAENQSEKEQFRSEISKTGKSIIYHSKNLNYLIDKNEDVKDRLLNKTFAFLLTFKPSISPQGLQTIKKKINRFNKYVEKDFCVSNYTGAVGIIIDKKHLKIILQDKETNRKTFGQIFQKVYQANGDQVALIIYQGGASDHRKKYIRSVLQPNFRLDGTECDLLICQPKQFGSDFAEVYLSAIHKIIQYTEPNPTNKTLDLTSNNTTLQQTSIIHSQSFVSQQMNPTKQYSNIINETILEPQKASDYQFNLNLTPKYGVLTKANANYEVGRKARNVNKEVEGVTGQDSDTLEVVISEKWRREEGEEGKTVTLLMNQNLLFRETEYCHLYKIKLGNLANGYLVQADITNLEEHANFFKGTNAAIYRPTHKCVVL